MRNGFAALPGEGETMTEIAMSRGGARIEIDRPPERGEGLLRAPFHHGGITESDLSPRVELVECDCAQNMLAAGPQPLVAIDPPVVRSKHQAKGKQASCPCILRVRRNGARQCVPRSLIVRARQPPDVCLRP